MSDGCETFDEFNIMLNSALGKCVRTIQVPLRFFILDMKNYIVYMHTVPNGRKYIGITCQQPDRRWRGGMHYNYNKRFFSAIVKYGWNNIKHEILFENLSQEEAEQKEIELIKEYHTDQEEYGYNMTSGGKGAKNCTVSLETREKLRMANTGKKASEETRKKLSEAKKGKFIGGKSVKARKILQYDLDGNLIKEWDSLKDIERALNVSYTCIWQVCNGKRKQVKGYAWKYKDENTNVQRRHNDNNSKTSLSFNEKTQSLARWSYELGIPLDVLWERLYRMNWSVEKAFTQPYKKRG